MKPLCIDLFCGKMLGWTEGFLAEGYDVIGYDIIEKPYRMPDGFSYVRQDIRTLNGFQFRNRARCIVASPPCNYYSKLDLPASWNRGWKEDDGGKLWNEAERIRKESGVPTVIENVRGAQRIHGKAVCHSGSRYLWGDVPIINPEPVYGKWRLPPSKDRTALRSKIPMPLASAVARAFK